MGLSTRQLARLSELLDQALPLTGEARRAWLEALATEDRPLVLALREALSAEDPEVGAVRSLAQPPSPGTERRSGERLGAYELLEPLGAGGMAEVWLARRADGVFERLVALKIPRLSHLPAEMAERFARECRILATLECPGVARLYDAGISANGIPYIAMEYVQGEPLLAWCDARSLDVQARLRLFAKVLDAVSLAHAHGVVHRDLKPSNILVTGDGEPRLLDFGVASLLDAESTTRSLTRVYGPALTPEYASPEQLRGEAVDVRSDIYSLGAVLHELLTGARPGKQASDRQLPVDLLQIVDRALSAAPEERYPNAAQFAERLRRHADGGALATTGRVAARKLMVGLAAMLLLAIGALSIYWLRSPVGRAAADTAAAAHPPVATIAVLPFVDLSERQDHGYLSDGLAEELIDLLTKIPELRVTARASSFAFRDRQVAISAIASQLNVDNVLEGSVRISGNRLKFTVQLVRARDGTVMWSESYDRELQDVFEIQEDVSAAVVDALKLQLLPPRVLAGERRTSNVRAYEEYLLGRQYRDGASRERNEHAQAAFQRAVELDPSFAPAHAGIALAAGDIGFATMQNAPYDLALTEAERAMALAPRLAEAYVARAKVRMGRNWDFVGAKSDLDFAMNIDPNNIELMQAYGSFLWMTGKVTDALAVQQRCAVHNPLASKTWDWLGLMFLNARDYPAARKAFARSAELSPYSDYRWLLATLVELHAGNHEAALRMARENPDRDFRDYTVALAAFTAGHEAESRAALRQLIARSPDMAAVQIAVIYAWRDEREQSFEWLERALALRDPGLFGMQYRPEFDKLRNDPRFVRVLRLMNIAG